MNLMPCEIDLSYTPFEYATIFTYTIQLPTTGKKIGFNLMDDDDFTIPYII